MKPHDVFGYVGITMFGGSLWVIHPAATIGFAGLFLMACGVHLKRQAVQQEADKTGRG